jgi:hypothetical protein
MCKLILPYVYILISASFVVIVFYRSQVSRLEVTLKKCLWFEKCYDLVSDHRIPLLSLILDFGFRKYSAKILRLSTFRQIFQLPSSMLMCGRLKALI